MQLHNVDCNLISFGPGARDWLAGTGQGEEGAARGCRSCMVVNGVRPRQTPSSLQHQVENGGEVVFNGKD